MAFRLALRLCYQGTRFSGWARQPGHRTVQGAVEEALCRLAGRFCPEGGVRVVGAARTDSGVHALDQVASFELSMPAPPETERMLRALTHMLPPDLRPLGMGLVPEAFDARRSSSSRVYRYFLAPGGTRSPFLVPFVAAVELGLDVARMADAAPELLGTIDMRSFAAHEVLTEPAPRTIHRATLTEAGGLLVLEVEADGFLRHAVRRMVGTLLLVGRHRMAPAEVGIVARSGDPRRAGPTAPAEGLFLWRARYPDGAGLGVPPASPASLLGLPGL